MAQKRRGLGRGLQALIPEAQKEKVSASRPSDVFFPESKKDDAHEENTPLPRRSRACCAGARADSGIAEYPRSDRRSLGPLSAEAGIKEPFSAFGRHPPERRRRTLRKHRFHVKPRRLRLRRRGRPRRRLARSPSIRLRRLRRPLRPSELTRPVRQLASVHRRRPQKRHPVRLMLRRRTMRPRSITLL